MSSKTSLSITEQARLCVNHFSQLRLLFPDSGPPKLAGISYSAVCDELGRFTSWARNTSALQDGQDQNSLGYRLRDAPDIADQVGKLLRDLSGLLEEVCTVLCKSAKAVKSSSEAAGDVASGEGLAASEAQVLLRSVAETITSLLKLSIVNQNPLS
ncbi:hypothetical protein MMC07_003065 [Pseudocyphellaria aurata]|nr:hypothetical protein [Pseudocyphellaria aurata]